MGTTVPLTVQMRNAYLQLPFSQLHHKLQKVRDWTLYFLYTLPEEVMSGVLPLLTWTYPVTKCWSARNVCIPISMSLVTFKAHSAGNEGLEGISKEGTRVRKGQRKYRRGSHSHRLCHSLSTFHSPGITCPGSDLRRTSVITAKTHSATVSIWKFPHILCYHGGCEPRRLFLTITLPICYNRKAILSWLRTVWADPARSRYFLTWKLVIWREPAGNKKLWIKYTGGNHFGEESVGHVYPGVNLLFQVRTQQVQWYPLISESLMPKARHSDIAKLRFLCSKPTLYPGVVSKPLLYLSICFNVQNSFKNVIFPEPLDSKLSTWCPITWILCVFFHKQHHPSEPQYNYQYQAINIDALLPFNSGTLLKFC